MSETKIIDARNTFCPGPLMELISNMKHASVGDVLELLSTDKGSAADIPEWLNQGGHELNKNEQIGEVLHITIRKTK